MQNYERLCYGADGPLPAPGRRRSTRWARRSNPGRWAARSGTPTSVPACRCSSPSTASAPRTTPCAPDFIAPALAGLLDAIDDGVPVLGYLHWTLLDNFEWIFGYAKHFGLHAVDRETFARTPKPSAEVYARLVRSHRVAAAGVRDDDSR